MRTLHLPHPTQVKNKTSAPIQISAEQILREAHERQEAEIRPPKQKITDSSELADYRLRKRKEFEDLIRRRVRWNISVWIKYAQWEESQKDFNRARSVWERALEVDYRNHTLWLKYAKLEMKNKFINHARNVWDRAVTLLPRVDQLWCKYIHMEEMLGNVAGARQIFERWMNWLPDQQGWLSYIKFELRYNEIDLARQIFERFVQCHPKVSVWIRYAKFEMKNGEIGRSRNVYERAVDELADDKEAEQLLMLINDFLVEIFERTEAVEFIKQITKEERNKFDEETLVNLNNIKKEIISCQNQEADESITTYMVRSQNFYGDLCSIKSLQFRATIKFAGLHIKRLVVMNSTSSPPITITNNDIIISSAKEKSAVDDTVIIKTLKWLKIPATVVASSLLFGMMIYGRCQLALALSGGHSYSSSSPSSSPDDDETRTSSVIRTMILIIPT
ncbi:hypothetical protein EZV62_010225 [Acer yangbiense]|uniref:Pre-mRNA-splicing factor Syf1-like N-terminal HAT-repeats domain-containing protein n=1 Tax=Acer yangbiense TaxID=1000413 RepID=A0A5C7I1Q4_9ROSI|nr:hypothetical protein EZV62_010225 [Acer yangbiense]